MNPGFHCTGQMADSVYGVVWVSGLLMSTLWIEWPMVAVGLWYGTAIEEEWNNIPLATINNLINSMRRRCVALREANGGHTRY